MTDNEQTVAGGGEEASANSKTCDMLFLAGMILVAAAYLLPFGFGVCLRDFSNASKGTIYHKFTKPAAFSVITNWIGLIRVFGLITVVSAIAGLVANFVIKNERRRYVTRAISSALVFIGVAAWFAYVCLRFHGLSVFSLFHILEISGALCALISVISLYIKQNAAVQSAGASSAEMKVYEQANTSVQVDESSQASTPAFDTPISMWGYFGYEILYSIPIAGIIALLINAFGAKNRNVKNFARSYFCFIIVVVILGAIVLGSQGIGLLSMFGHHRGGYGW